MHPRYHRLQHATSNSSTDATHCCGAPFPLQYTGVSRLDSVWQINVPANGVYDASYDIWLDSNTRTCPVGGRPARARPAPMALLPDEPRRLNSPGQNDGAEVMIWVGHNGYTVTPAGQTPRTNTIQPAGTQLNLDANGNVAPVTIAGIDNSAAPRHLDVWVRGPQLRQRHPVERHQLRQPQPVPTAA